MITASRALSRVGRRTIAPPIFRFASPTAAAKFPAFRTLPAPSNTPRRHNASSSKPAQPDSQHPTAQSAPQSSATIPGPSWLWLEPIYEPFRAYGRVHKRKPYMTQFVSALVIYFVGDIVAQSLGGQAATTTDTIVQDENKDGVTDEGPEKKGWVQEWVEGRDWHRTGRALFIGGLAAVPGYKWFLWLSNSFNYSSRILSLSTKIAVNQALFTPVFNTYFFGMQSLLSGAAFPDIVERVKNTVPTSVINSLKVWPAVTAFSFTFIPLHYRSIFGGVIAIGWQTYLSLLNQRAAKEEEVAHMQENGQPKQEESTARVDTRTDQQKCAV